MIPNIFENIFPKIANIVAFSLFFFLGLSENGAFGLFIMVFFFALLGYVYYANQLEPINVNLDTTFIKKDKLWKKILNFSFYGFLGNLGNFIAVKIDNLMISESYLGFGETGIYNVFLNIISLISIPQMGLYNISAPIINKSMEENDMQGLDAFHKKTSLSIYFLGAVLFSCIVVGFPFLAELMPNGKLLLASEPIIWIIGTAVLIDLATGFNGNIISMSKFYRFNIIIMISLAFLTVLLNLLFLKYTTLGIIGVAFATAISLTLYNVVKIIFNYKKFKVHPLTIQMLYTSIICIFAIVFTHFLPNFELSFINLIYKPMVVLFIIYIGNSIFRIYPIHQYLNTKFIKDVLKF